MRNYTPSQLEINAMRQELAANGFTSFMRKMKECTNKPTIDIIKVISAETGVKRDDIRSWKHQGVCNGACANVLCGLAEESGFYFGKHMLIPTKAVCEQWLEHERHNFSGK